MHMVMPSAKDRTPGPAQTLQARVLALTGGDDRNKIEPTQVPETLCRQRDGDFPGVKKEEHQSDKSPTQPIPSHEFLKRAPIITFLEHMPCLAKDSAVGGNDRNPATNFYYPSRVTTRSPLEKATLKGLTESQHG